MQKTCKGKKPQSRVNTGLAGCEKPEKLQTICKNAVFRETRSQRDSGNYWKSCKNITKEPQIFRFKALKLELLTRFELVTSSLPTACRVKNTQFYVIFNTFTSKTICSLTLINPPCPCADFAGWVGAWVSTVPPARRETPAGAQEYPPE